MRALGYSALFSLLVWAGITYALVSASWGHSWYDGECCSEKDCRQTTLGEVERHDDGWYIAPLKLTVPFGDSRIRHSLDPLIHICEAEGGHTNGLQNPPTLRCLYIPDVPT